MVKLDGIESSFIDLDQPDHLEFEYMHYMREAAELWRGTCEHGAYLHLGAGACALPRALHERAPLLRQVAVEYDEILSQRIREWFDLPRSPALRIRHGDGREAIEQARPHSWDLVTRDVFASSQVPARFRTMEFFESLRACLTPDGLALLNTESQPANHDLSREIATINAVFGESLIIGEPAVLKRRGRGNVVIATGPGLLALDHSALASRLGRSPIPGSVLESRSVRQLQGRSDPLRDAELSS